MGKSTIGLGIIMGVQISVRIKSARMRTLKDLNGL
jgi:hypothetical protein